MTVSARWFLADSLISIIDISTWFSKCACVSLCSSKICNTHSSCSCLYQVWHDCVHPTRNLLSWATGSSLLGLIHACSINPTDDWSISFMHSSLPGRRRVLGVSVKLIHYNNIIIIVFWFPESVEQTVEMVDNREFGKNKITGMTSSWWKAFALKGLL